MAGRTPHEAVNAFVEPLRRALSRVTKRVLVVSPGGYAPRDVHVATVSGGQAVRLKAPNPLGLIVSIQYRIVQAERPLGPWKIAIAQYDYALRDAADVEILSFHWHPEGRSEITRPHVHIGTPALRVAGPLDRRKHIPTGRISVEEVLRFAIVDLGVEPLHDDWDQVFETGQHTFEEWRTWP